MKIRSLRLAAVMSAVLLSLSVPAMVRAESTTLTVSVPFDFYMGGEKLSSGVYTIRAEAAGNSILRLFDATGRQSIVMPTLGRNRGDLQTASLAFTKYENAYFLTEVRWTGAPNAHILPRSPMEIQLGKVVAAKQVATTNRD